MTTHRFAATTWHNVLGTLPPALTVASGDTVITETIDAHGLDKDGVRRAPEPNPMNGPILTGFSSISRATPSNSPLTQSAPASYGFGRPFGTNLWFVTSGNTRTWVVNLNGSGLPVGKVSSTEPCAAHLVTLLLLTRNRREPFCEIFGIGRSDSCGSIAARS